MDARKLCAAAVRFYALMLVIGSLVVVPQTVSWLSLDSSERSWVVGSLLGLVAHEKPPDRDG